jgi:hypothetical protein
MTATRDTIASRAGDRLLEIGHPLRALPPAHPANRTGALS